MQQLSDNPAFASIFHVQHTDTHVMLVVPEYHETLLEYIRTMRSRPVDELVDVTRLVKKLWKAVAYLHQQRLVHRDLRLKNIYLHRYNNGSKWRVVIGGLKYAKESAQIALENSGSLLEDFRRHIVPFGYGSDKFQLAYAMYCLLRQEVMPNPVGGPFLKLEFPNIQRYSYRQLMLKHLTQVVWENYNLRTSDILHHPFFMTIGQMVAFEDRMLGFSAGNLHVDPHIEIDRSEVFSGQWTSLVDREVVIACNQRSRVNSNTFIGLWQARRNRSQNGDKDLHMQHAMGPLHESNFLYWEETFPAFFIHLWQRLLSYQPLGSNGAPCGRRVYELSEFAASEFFPATAHFYHVCIHIPIIG